LKIKPIQRRIRKSDYSVQCLELPGAISQGKTKEDALANIKEAIELVLEVINEETR